MPFTLVPGMPGFIHLQLGNSGASTPLALAQIISLLNTQARCKVLFFLLMLNNSTNDIMQQSSLTSAVSTTITGMAYCPPWDLSDTPH